MTFDVELLEHLEALHGESRLALIHMTDTDIMREYCTIYDAGLRPTADWKVRLNTARWYRDILIAIDAQRGNL